MLVENLAGTRRFYAKSVVDSGAALSVFDASVAEGIGIHLESGKRQRMRGVGGEVEVWRHEVKLHLPGGVVTADVGFQRNLLTSGLLGMAGFFEHFRVSFDGRKRVCEVERLPMGKQHPGGF